MKKTKIKRLVYRHLSTNEIIYGAEQYDGRLSTPNILGSIYTKGKHEWCPDAYQYAMYQFNSEGLLQYRITVETFYQYEKSSLNLLMDNIKRILGI